ncbi:MAG: nicotinate-nucleotide--dimethylbenzimidazole phosphoribosyltransferase [Alcaligenaceae bacterium]|nr:nicotinate-nucleotide--dimethylbenzimidazole phosphoribosyltransferase [Alcaligenaceae bacterium]
MLLPDISPIHDSSLAAALDAAIDGKTKPQGSLGRLEALAKQVGLVQGSVRPVVSNPCIVVFAGDHGVAEEGVSAYPQEVTWQMVENFLAGGAAINVFARRNGIDLRVVDAGVKHDFGQRTGLLSRKIGPGTRNFMREPAMTADECRRAVQSGMDLVAELPGNVLGFGEMGIANTTAAAAILHCLGGVPVEDCVGAGTGLDFKGVQRKDSVLRAAIARHADARQPLEVLATLGGYEIAMMAGAMLGAAGQRRLLLIDGFIVGSALLVAARLRPAILDYCVFAHRSNERGHARMLECLDAEPLLDLGMRLGEGTGGALALPLVHAAVDFLNDMASFDSAGVRGGEIARGQDNQDMRQAAMAAGEQPQSAHHD